MRLYVDGEPAGSRESTLAIRDNPTPLVLGGLRSGYGNVKGALDEPAVYGRALTPARSPRTCAPVDGSDPARSRRGAS